MHALTVRPLPIGWSLEVSEVANPMLFSSGGAAEAAARQLAGRLAAAGKPARLTVLLRDGTVGGRFLFPPVAPAHGDALSRAA